MNNLASQYRESDKMETAFPDKETTCVYAAKASWQ